MAEDRETWTRLVLNCSNGPAQVWTQEPILSVAEAITKRRPIKIESGEYVHPDHIARFYSHALWEERNKPIFFPEMEQTPTPKKRWYRRR